eukprot:364843-Chlamydomonas_euryale.AAC.16
MHQRSVPPSNWPQPLLHSARHLTDRPARRLADQLLTIANPPTDEPKRHRATARCVPQGRRKVRGLVLTVAERFALLATFARMGVRPPADAVARALANSYPYLK